VRPSAFELPLSEAVLSTIALLGMPGDVLSMITFNAALLLLLSAPLADVVMAYTL